MLCQISENVYLIPEQSTEAEEKRPHPEIDRQRDTGEDQRSALDEEDLNGQCTDPDHAEQFVGEDPTENVDFTVNSPTVDLIEQCHQNEGVKDQREVFGRSVTIRTGLSIMNIEGSSS